MEIYIPDLHKTCQLENLPDSYRESASLCGGLLCGGTEGMPADAYCLRWYPESWTFRRTSVKRSIGADYRRGLSCWDLGDRGALIMGYNRGGDNRTTDLVSLNGLTNSPSFPLKHKIR